MPYPSKRFVDSLCGRSWLAWSQASAGGSKDARNVAPLAANRGARSSHDCADAQERHPAAHSWRSPDLASSVWSARLSCGEGASPWDT